MANLTRTGRSKRIVYTNYLGSGGTKTEAIYLVFDRTSTDAKSGAKNPGWRQAVRKVFQAGSPYTRTLVLNGMVSGKVSGDYHPNTAFDPGYRNYEEISGQFNVGPSVPSLPNMSHLDVQAKVKFIQKCRGLTRAFQGGVFLGELREALHMIIRPASALRNDVRRYSTTVKNAVRAERTAKGKAKAMSGTWLEWSYGWRPLFNDVDQGMAALADTSHLYPDVVSATSKDEWTVDRVKHSFSAPGNFIRGNCVFVTKATGFVRYLGCVAWESQNRADTWQSHWGLTLSDFAPTVWELIPYSFLVDYFSNVGAVIDASSFGEVSLRWGIRSSVSRADVSLHNPFADWSSSSVTDSTQSASLGLSPLSRFNFSRSLVNSVSVGIGDLQFQCPGIGDWRKWANIAALATEKIL